MQVDFDEILCNLAGVPLNGQGEAITLKMVAINALMAAYEGERAAPGEKFARYSLARRIFKGNYEFKAEEIKKLKDLIERSYEPIVVGAAFSVLSGEAQFDPKIQATPETQGGVLVSDLEGPADEHECGVPA